MSHPANIAAAMSLSFGRMQILTIPVCTAQVNIKERIGEIFRM